MLLIKLINISNKHNYIDTRNDDPRKLMKLLFHRKKAWGRYNLNDPCWCSFLEAQQQEV